MLVEKILGRLKETDTAGKQIMYVDIEWDEAFKKVHRKKTASGLEVGIRLDDSVLTKGLHEGDVLYVDDKLVIAVHTPPCEAIRIVILPDHAYMAAKVCYEIGNRHAPLFYGEDASSYLTPYDEPMFFMLKKLDGVNVLKTETAFDLIRKISQGAHNHRH